MILLRKEEPKPHIRPRISPPYCISSLRPQPQDCLHLLIIQSALNIKHSPTRKTQAGRVDSLINIGVILILSSASSSKSSWQALPWIRYITTPSDLAARTAGIKSLSPAIMKASSLDVRCNARKNLCIPLNLSLCSRVGFVS